MISTLRKDSAVSFKTFSAEFLNSVCAEVFAESTTEKRFFLFFTTENTGPRMTVREEAFSETRLNLSAKKTAQAIAEFSEEEINLIQNILENGG